MMVKLGFSEICIIFVNEYSLLYVLSKTYKLNIKFIYRKIETKRRTICNIWHNRVNVITIESLHNKYEPSRENICQQGSGTGEMLPHCEAAETG